MNVTPRTRVVLDTLGGLLTAATAALLAWRSAIGALDALASGEESTIMGLPLWWSMSAFAPGFALLACVALYTTWQDFSGKGDAQ
jgi:TRAP-type C4-dicarboxylate transport system permease small subunit